MVYNFEYKLNSSGYAFGDKTFDPDELPVLTPEEINTFRRARNDYTWVDRDREARNVSAYYTQKQNEIDEIRVHTGSTGRTGEWGVELSGIVDIPVAVLHEPPERLARVVESVGQAADTYGADPFAIRPWLNFTLDPRREQAKAVKVKQAIDLAQVAVNDTIKGHNLVPQIAVDHVPYDTTMSTIRQRMFLAALGLMFEQRPRMEHKLAPQDAANNIYFLVDADTIISPDSFVKAHASLSSHNALLVSGNLHYIEGIMDKNLEEVKKENIEMRLLYLAEHIRRLMVNHLPPTAKRGYVPEAGLATTLSILASLGGFDVRAKDNESYGLELKALRATQNYLEAIRSNQREVERLPDEPYIVEGTLRSLESITRYENYDINTSIDGVEASVRRLGAAAIIDFDHGEHYTMRTRADRDPRHSLGQPYDPLLIINSVFSSYRDTGGELLLDGLFKVNKLITDLGLVHQSELTPGSLAWTPKYIPKSARPSADA